MASCGEKWAHLRCARCKQVYYCSREHQAADWPRHREACDAAVANNGGDGACDGNGDVVRARAPRIGAATNQWLHGDTKGGLAAKVAMRQSEVAQLNSRMRQAAARLGRSGTGTGTGNGDGRSTSNGVAGHYRRAEDADIGRALDGMTAAELEAFLAETARLRDLARASLREMQQDAKSTADWEVFESGFETRDVLENGERRAHMEARLGRKAELQDVTAEKDNLTLAERRERMLDGMAKANDSRLPGPVDAGKTIQWAKQGTTH